MTPRRPLIIRRGALPKGTREKIEKRVRMQTQAGVGLRHPINEVKEVIRFAEELQKKYPYTLGPKRIAAEERNYSLQRKIMTLQLLLMMARKVLPPSKNNDFGQAVRKLFSQMHFFQYNISEEVEI